MRLWNGLSISATYHISALAISIDAKSACEKGPFYKLFFLILCPKHLFLNYEENWQYFLESNSISVPVFSNFLKAFVNGI